jgi:hypothetical protein
MVIAFGLALVGGLILLYRYDRLPGGNRIKKRQKRRVVKPKPQRESQTKNKT